jgi:peptidoglycan/LPS O-acetylase OafA/YrhL
VVTVLAAIPFIRYGGTIFAPGETWNFPVLIYPLVVGVGYATLLLAILWGNRAIRWFFESPPLRFIGLISFSLYLWHDPSILGMIPFVAALPLVVRVLAAFIIAYLSYQLIERPFLNRRRRTEQPGGARDAAKTLAAAQAQDVASARA